MKNNLYWERLAQKESAGNRRREMRREKRRRTDRLVLRAQQKAELERALEEGLKPSALYANKGRPVLPEDAHIALFGKEYGSEEQSTAYARCVDHVVKSLGLLDRADAEYAIDRLSSLYSLVELAYSMHVNNSVNFRDAVDMVSKQRFTESDVETYHRAYRLSESFGIRIGDAIEISALMDSEEEELPESSLALRERVLDRIPSGAIPREIPVSQLGREESLEVREMLYGHDGTNDHRFIDPDA